LQVSQHVAAVYIQRPKLTNHGHPYK
jgi:hypothetical protein